MKFYFAPLEGVTNKFYRNAFDKHFSGVDKFYIPFLNPMSCHSLTNKEYREINPENNKLKGQVVPQIISRDADATLWLISHLKSLGYEEVNLNFGCPSGTVVAKGRGSGMLKDLEYMDNYLNEVFSKTELPISIKLRIGITDPSEFDAILKVLNKYDIKELIVHPRTTKDKYVGPIHLEIMEDLDKKTNFDIIYNGDVKTKKDIKYIQERFPYIKGIMLGRGLIAIPDLVEEENYDDEFKRNRIKEFFNDLSKEYLEMFGWNNTSFFLKEIWRLLCDYFIIPNSLKKDLFKSKKQEDLFFYTDKIISTCEINTCLENGIKC